MFRFRSHHLIRLYSKQGFQSLFRQTKYQRNVNKLPLNPYSTESDVTGAANSLSKISDNLREKRLNLLKRTANSTSEWDVLSESIIRATTIEQIIELLSSHVNVMNNKHLSSAFESIGNIVKLSNNSNEDYLKILSSNQFKQLCNQTVKRIRFFQTTEVLTTLKCLINLNVSPNTTVVQSLLQMSRQLINDFTLNEIIFLEYLLRKQLDERKSEAEDISEIEISDEIKGKPKRVIPLLEALKLAIPLVLQLKIESKEIDLDDIELVCRCLQIAAKHHLKDEVINKLAATVSHHLNELTVSQTYTVIGSLMLLTTVNTNINTNLTEKVLNNCLNKVTETGAGVTPGAHHNLIVSIILNNHRRNFYHKGLYEMAANIIVQNPAKFINSKVTGVLWALTKQNHVHYGLMDLIADRLYQKDLDLIDSDKTSFTNILQAFALPSNYRPNEAISEVVYKTILSSNHVKLSKKQKTKHLLFRILRYFAVLNYYPKEEIRDWIENHLESALSQSTLLNFRIEFIENLQILYQGLCLESNFDDFQDLKKVLKPLIEELNAFQSKLFDDKYKSNSLEFALEQGLGGHQFIANNVISDFGHNIDHLIVMRKGGYPVSIDSQSLKKPIHISDLQIPNDSDLIGIIPLSRKDYCREPVIKKGDTDFRLRTLQKTGIITVPVNLDVWESLAEIEKIPYIMRTIQENLNSKQIEKI